MAAWQSADHSQPSSWISETFELHAVTDAPPRQNAKAEFVQRVRGGRALRSLVADLISDGYVVTITAPDGAAFSGRAVPPLRMMDPDLGYGPRPEFVGHMEFRHGTWLLNHED